LAKGDGNIRYYELYDNSLHYLNEFRDGITAKAYFYFNKNVVDVQRCEVLRIAKLFESTLEIVSII
jgi:membrane carboxypeptidase/penicillin-binding protein